MSSLGIPGVVEDATVHHTVVRIYHNNRTIIPNSIISRAVVESSNYNNNYIGSHIGVLISYENNLEQAIEVMREAIASYPLVMSIRLGPSEENKVNMAIKKLRDDGTILKSMVWTRDVDGNFAVCSDIHRLTKKNLSTAGISIPHRHVHVITGDSDKKSENNGIMQK